MTNTTKHTPEMHAEITRRIGELCVLGRTAYYATMANGSTFRSYIYTSVYDAVRSEMIAKAVQS